MIRSAPTNPVPPALLCTAIGTFLIVVTLVVMAGQANGIHGQCHDASWYYFSAVFLPAGILVAVPLVTVAVAAGVICARRVRRAGNQTSLLFAVVGILMSLGASAGLVGDLYSIRDLLLAKHPVGIVAVDWPNQ